MKEPTAFDEFLLGARDELSQAYAAGTQARHVPSLVAAALQYARTHADVVSRAANPVGYLYRVGQARSGGSGRGFLRWDSDADATSVDPAVVTELDAMPRTQATTVWLVKACGWTNLQTAEALELSPAGAADHVTEGMARLLAAASSGGNDVELQLQALATQRLALTPAEAQFENSDNLDTGDPGPSGDTKTDSAAESTSTSTAKSADGDVAQTRVSRPRRGLVMSLAAVGLVIAVVLVVVTRGDESVEVPSVKVSVGGMQDREVVPQSAWEQPASAEQPASTFALARVGSDGPILVADVERARTSYLPASTYKLLHALIALDADVVASIDSIIPWDGVTREVEAWNQDQTVASAIRESAVWAFQDLASRIGEDRMAAGVSAADYGNENIAGSLTSFWLDGSLRTSAIDQLEFLERLTQANLPFDATQQGQVQASLPRLDGPGTRIAYETGTALAGGVAWLVGIVDTADGQWVFAYNTDFADSVGGPQPPTTEQRLEVVVDLLTSAGVLDAS